MQQMTRLEAETLFDKSKIIASNIEQDGKEMRILLTLSDQCSFMVKYDLLTRQKSYYIIRIQ